MKTRKTILNDSGKPLTKTQAKKEAQAFILQQALKAWEGGNSSAEIHFDEPADGAGEITLNDLLELSAA